MDSTVRSPRETDAVAAAPGWVLVIAHHPQRAWVGTSIVVGGGDELVLGRGGAAFGAGALDDGTLSRRHAGLTLAAGELRIADLGSRNGTWVNGGATTAAALAPGDVIELGDILVLAIRPTAAPRPIDDPEIGAISGVMGQVVDELRRVAGHRTTVFLVGETGSGKSVLARAVHRWSGRGPLVALPCATLTAERIAAELHGPGRIAQADGGTLVLDGIDDAPPAVQAALRAFLEDRALQPAGPGAARPLDVRVIATARGLGLVRAELASRLERFVVRTPPLRERPEDVAVLARAAFDRAGRTPSKRLVLAMLRHAWPLNGGELDSVVERALIDAGDDDPVPLSPAVAARLGVSAAASPAVMTIAGDGSWLRPAGGDQVSLRRRENLALILGALCAARREQPGRSLSVAALFRAGWPEQRADARAAAGRVYVALTSLRNLGLRDLLRRDDDGYALDPDAAIELVD